MKRIPWLVQKRADKSVKVWANQYPDPEADADTIDRDITRWINPAADELMDFAQDRPLRQYSGLMFAFTGAVCAVAFTQAFESGGAAEHNWWVQTLIAVLFFGPAILLVKPLKTSTTRARFRSYLGREARAKILKRRAFIEPAPGPLTDGVRAKEAEQLVAAWMRHLGAPESSVTRYGADGGIDVRAQRFVAQVKNRTDKVPVAVVRDMYGAATAEGRAPLFFTASSYTGPARAFARGVGMPLFIYRAVEGRLVAANPQAQHYLANGFHVPLPEHLRGSSPVAIPARELIGAR